MVDARVRRFKGEVDRLLFFYAQRLRVTLGGDEREIARANSGLVAQKQVVMDLYRVALLERSGGKDD